MPARDARELSILLRISKELDIIVDVDVDVDVTATVDNPSELIAWATILEDPKGVAWRAEYSEHRYLQVSSDRHREPIRGRSVPGTLLPAVPPRD